jgi:hypothetical protein
MPTITPRLTSKPIVVPISNYYAILDSGTTGTFVTTKDAHHLVNPIKVNDGPVALSASGNPMVSITQGQLPPSRALSPIAQEAFELDSLKTGSLVALSKLCDDDCLALFSKYDVKIIKNDHVIITGTRLPNGLWSVPIESPPWHQINGILRTDKVRSELATYHHTTMDHGRSCPFYLATRHSARPPHYVSRLNNKIDI